MANIQPFALSSKSHDALLIFFRQCYSMLNLQYDIRGKYKAIDYAYMREVDQTVEQYKAKTANRAGDPTKFQNIVVPVVMPQVEAATTYQQSVFLQGYPIFGAVAGPELIDEAMQMDTLMAEHQVQFNWVPELLKFFRNGFKYNLAAVEVSWDRKVTYAVETDTTFQDGKQGKPVQVIAEGNRITCMDMYNTFFDTRCFPHEIPEFGEFAGYTRFMGRMRLKQFIASLPVKINVTKALESGSSAAPSSGGFNVESYYMPQLNPNALLQTDRFDGMNWMAWAGLAQSDEGKIAYRNGYEVTTLYGRILPSDFAISGVPGPQTPQVWKFIIVNHQVIIYAERLTNAHNLIPILFGQPLDDGLGYQTKSLGDNVQPIQEITTALANSSIASRRRAIGDRMLFDPTRVSPAAINNDNPTSKIPVRPSAFDTDISKAVHQLPFRDDQFQINGAEIQLYLGMGNQITGSNPARQGQFVKGNKTRTEFSDTLAYANGRDQTISLSLEGSVFVPLKEILKVNILQYQGNGKIFNRELQQSVQIDPVALRNAAVAMKLSDGLNPADKIIDADSLAMGFQTLASSDRLQAAYNMGPMFSYLMKIKGARISPFEKSQPQIAYEQATAAWQQTVTAIMQSIMKNIESMNPEDIQKMLPPQPKPQDYGFDPQSTNPANKVASVAASSGAL